MPYKAKEFGFSDWEPCSHRTELNNFMWTETAIRNQEEDIARERINGAKILSQPVLVSLDKKHLFPFFFCNKLNAG